MTAQEYLSQAFMFNLKLKAKEEQILRLREMSQSAGTIAYGGERVQTTRKIDRMGDAIAQIEELIDVYARDVTRLLYMKNKISQAIEEVPDPMRRLILEKRYINFDSFEKIADDINYTERHVYNLHKKALGEIVVPDEA